MNKENIKAMYKDIKQIKLLCDKLNDDIICRDIKYHNTLLNKSDKIYNYTRDIEHILNIALIDGKIKVE